MIKSIRLRMTITYLLLILAVMLATGIVLHNMLEQHYLSTEEENLQRTGGLVAELVSTYLREEADPVLLSSVAESFSRQIDARVIIVGPQYLVLGDSVRIGGRLGTQLEREEIESALEGQIGQTVQYSQQSEQWVLQVAVPVGLEEEAPTGAVFLSASLEPVYEALSTIRSFMFVSTLLALILAGTLAVLFAHHLTVPIKRLTEAARQMAEGDLEQNIPVTSGDEIGQLAEQFNIMAEKVKGMNQRLTRFVGDVSHELRTPLASINLCLQSLQNYEMEPQEQKEFLEDISQETQRMIYLVEDLLELTRRQEVADQKDIVPLRLVLNEVLETTIPRAERKGLLFFSEIEEELPLLQISAEALKRVLLNLLDNALKFTEEGGRVKLSAYREDETVQITVEDTGSGIPEESLPHVFERFYRVDKARSRFLGGTGLGLAICKEIVEHYGGEIGVTSLEGEGSTFFFTLPVDPALQPDYEPSPSPPGIYGS